LRFDLTKGNSQGWQLNRQVNLSVLVQMVLLGSLILGSWFNLQGRLDMLARDVSELVESQKGLELKLESLQTKSISYEYRLRAIEKDISKADVTGRRFVP
jgi:hypothetical protein